MEDWYVSQGYNSGENAAGNAHGESIVLVRENERERESETR